MNENAVVKKSLTTAADGKSYNTQYLASYLGSSILKEYLKEGVYAIKPNKRKINSKFLMYLLQCQSVRDLYLSKAAGGTVQSVPMGEMKKLKIPVPPMDVQERIVKVLDNFDAICSDLGIGLPAEIEKRQKQYEYYRDKLLSFQN